MQIKIINASKDKRSNRWQKFHGKRAYADYRMRKHLVCTPRLQGVWHVCESCVPFSCICDTMSESRLRQILLARALRAHATLLLLFLIANKTPVLFRWQSVCFGGRIIGGLIITAILRLFEGECFRGSRDLLMGFSGKTFLLDKRESGNETPAFCVGNSVWS